MAKIKRISYSLIVGASDFNQLILVLTFTLLLLHSHVIVALLVSHFDFTCNSNV